MKRNFLLSLLLLPLLAFGQSFDTYFMDKTLRIDYIFAGDAQQQRIFVDELNMMPGWYGRRERLAELPLAGNGQITVKDRQTGTVLYRNSFSTLFQEWLATDEAKHTGRSFENVFLVPFPKQAVEVIVELRDNHSDIVASIRHAVDPHDILIRHTGEKYVTPYQTIQAARDSTKCIHIAFVAEGYTDAQMEDYINDCKEATEALFAHEPFRQYRDRFNIIALKSCSADEGTSEPKKGEWKNTAIGSHFDTFYSDRYLTTPHLKKLHDVLAGTPYEHIIILVNTPTYGGGGIYNSYNLSYTKGKAFLPVVVHEFGHGFGGLADEYEYGESDPIYFADTEPWEPNITTKHDFSGKWGNLIKEGKAGLIEGGGYQKQGVYRGVADCRMRTNQVPDFCAVCQQALSKLIKFYTE